MHLGRHRCRICLGEFNRGGPILAAGRPVLSSSQAKGFGRESIGEPATTTSLFEMPK